MDINELDRLTALRKAMTQGEWISDGYQRVRLKTANPDGCEDIAHFYHENKRPVDDSVGVAALVNAFDSLAELARLGLMAKEYVDALDEWHKSKSDEHAANADYTMERYLEAARRLEVKRGK